MIRTSVKHGVIAVSIASLAIVAACTTDTSKTASTDSGAAANPAFSTFVDNYFDSTFAYQPSFGTASGFHQYDNKIEDYSAPTINRRIATLKSFQARLDSLKSGSMSSYDSIDAAMIDGAIKSELQDFEVIGSWKKNPMNYVGTPGNAVDLLMKRNFASPDEAAPLLWQVADALAAAALTAQELEVQAGDERGQCQRDPDDGDRHDDVADAAPRDGHQRDRQQDRQQLQKEEKLYKSGKILGRGEN